MKSCNECLACLYRNAVHAAGRILHSEEEELQCLRGALRILADADMELPPPCHAWKIAEMMAEGREADPFKEEKLRSAILAEKLLPKLKRSGLYDPEDFESRLRLAIAGNILDFGIYADLDIDLALDSVKQAFSAPLDGKNITALKERMDKADSIFYALDNCGESVFDREFMAPYRSKVVLAVRGMPIFNDVTRDDLAPSGLKDFTRSVVDNGSRLPGVVEKFMPEEFRREFNGADIIISKGQGNFETLSETERPIAFLFLAKCVPVQRYIDAEEKSLQLLLKNF